MSEVLKSIDAEIEAASERLVAVEQEIEAAKSRKREAQAEIKRLRTARAYVTGERQPRSTPRTGSAKAGPAAVRKVRDAASRKGKITQAEITKETGLNSGQVSAAVRDLEASGVLKDTGVKVGRTREFEFVGG